MTSLNATYRGDDLASGGGSWLKLSQQEYASGDLADTTTIMAMLNLVKAGQNSQQALPDCAGLAMVDDPASEIRLYEWTTKVYVDLSADDLDYSLKPSRGVLGPMTRETISHERSFTFARSDHIDLGQRLVGDFDLVWETPVYNGHTRRIAAPTIKAVGQYLVADTPCFGVVRLKYATGRHTYELTIKDDGTEDPFKSTLSCFWSGGVEQLNITTAPCVADRLASCAGSVPAPIDIKGPPTQLYVKYDFCTGRVVAEYYDY